MKIRLWGTKPQINEMLEILKGQLGSRIQSISKPYKDRAGDNYRVYVDVAEGGAQYGMEAQNP